MESSFSKWDTRIGSSKEVWGSSDGSIMRLGGEEADPPVADHSLYLRKCSLNEA